MNVLKSITGWAASVLACVAIFSVTASAQSKPQLTDPEIASVVLVANKIDVNYGRIALKKTKNKDVLHFANTMIKDHGSLIKATEALAKKLHVTPKNNALSESLLKGERTTTAKFSRLKGNAFAKAYIDNEVAYHKAVIDAVKTILIPEAQNAELKKTLISVTPLLEHHYQMAQEIQAKMK